MKLLLMIVFFGGLGYWVGANYSVPLWLIVILLVLGTGAWGLAEWKERQEASDRDSR